MQFLILIRFFFSLRLFALPNGSFILSLMSERHVGARKKKKSEAGPHTHILRSDLLTPINPGCWLYLLACFTFGVNRCEGGLLQMLPDNCRRRGMQLNLFAKTAL